MIISLLQRFCHQLPGLRPRVPFAFFAHLHPSCRLPLVNTDAVSPHPVHSCPKAKTRTGVLLPKTPRQPPRSLQAGERAAGQVQAPAGGAQGHGVSLSVNKRPYGLWILRVLKGLPGPPGRSFQQLCKPSPPIFILSLLQRPDFPTRSRLRQSHGWESPSEQKTGQLAPPRGPASEVLIRCLALE